MTNKDLLYCTGNSTQYSVMTYVVKESKKEWIYVNVGFPGGLDSEKSAGNTGDLGSIAGSE